MQLPLNITDCITLLGSELFNLYLVRGETNAIIEGGVSAVAYPFLNQLNQLDVSPESISHLVILHSHFDHMMVFPLLKNRYPWMKIVSSVLNRATFSNERIMGKIFDSDRMMTLTLMDKGLISEAPTLTPSAPFPLDIALEEGSILDLGKGATIRFIEAPGHAPDCLCAYLEKEETLFCTDAAGFYTPPDFFRPNYWYRLDDAEKSLDKMKAIDPQVLCRGHYGAISGREEVRRHLKMGRQAIEDFKTFVLERIQEGWSMDKITEGVTERFSRGFLQFFPPEDNQRLWRLLVQRTLEHLSGCALIS
ncbi:MAG: MBL fold metallo-hydrolase [Deltaproteobacteria bacterium]|nr:MBL fold metallo-hydrolase [Deltaproteobacteria bacterium]